jgi:hypothetical protein
VRVLANEVAATRQGARSFPPAYSQLRGGRPVRTRTVVTNDVLGSGVMDTAEDTAHVLVYLNQVSKKPGVDPEDLREPASMTMSQQGNQSLEDGLKCC